MDHFNQVISTQFILPNSSLNALRVVAVIFQKITYLSLSPGPPVLFLHKISEKRVND